VAESFIFIYLGMAVFTSGDEVWDQFGFVMYSLLVVLVTRFIVVVPLMLFYNMFRSPADKLGFNKIFVLWLAGLRGAIAFALAAQSPYRLKNTLTGQVSKVNVNSVGFDSYAFLRLLRGTTLRFNRELIVNGQVGVLVRCGT
jgi:NhaP-type Na+/H+ or K+/H+ antiporter